MDDYKEFDKAFEKLLESDIYERAEDALLSIVRAAFAEGWKAAGGKLPDKK